MKTFSIWTVGGCVLALMACGSSSSTSDAGTGGTSGASNCNLGEPNNTRETATAVNLNQVYAGVCVDGPNDPKDFYELTAPATDLAGGYVQVQLRNVANQAAEVEVWAASDNDSVLDHYTTTPGANLDAWFTVAPGGKYRASVHMFAGETPQFTYDLQFKYTAINDAFEPNNTRETAKPITLGTPIMASAAVAALGAEPAATEKEDWYAVTLAAGKATVLVSNVPADTTCDLTVYGPDGSEIDEKYDTTEGANCKLELPDSSVAGAYKIKLERFAGIPPRAGDTAMVPQYLSGQYTLVVTQP